VKTIRHFCFFFVAALLMTAAAFAQTRDQDEVTSVFGAYKTAIMNDRGQEAAALLSQATVSYFEQMRDVALYGSRQELNRLSTMNLLQTLIMRHRVPADRLVEMSGIALLTYAIEQGWIGKNSVAPLKAQRVYVVGDTAVLDVVSDRGPGKAQMRFRREDLGWRLDLLSVIQAGSDQLDNVAKQRGESREELVMALLSATSGRQVEDSIWQPPLQRQ
jgi:hypothetical protein